MPEPPYPFGDPPTPPEGTDPPYPPTPTEGSDPTPTPQDPPIPFGGPYPCPYCQCNPNNSAACPGPPLGGGGVMRGCLVCQENQVVG